MPKNRVGLDTVDQALFWKNTPEYLRQSREAARQTGPVRTGKKEADDATPPSAPQDEEGAP